MPESLSTASFSHQLDLKVTEFKQPTDSYPISEGSLHVPNTRVSRMYSIIDLKLTLTEFSMRLRGKALEELIKPSGDKSTSFHISRVYCECQSSTEPHS